MPGSAHFLSFDHKTQETAVSVSMTTFYTEADCMSDKEEGEPTLVPGHENSGRSVENTVYRKSVN